MAAGNKDVGFIIVLSDELHSMFNCVYDCNICTATKCFSYLSMAFLNIERRYSFHVYPAVDQVFKQVIDFSP